VFRDLHWLIRAFRRLTQGEKRLFQALADCAVRLVKNERLVLIQEILPQPVKEMQEMAQECDSSQCKPPNTMLGFEK